MSEKTIRYLKIRGFRCFHQVDIELTSGINLFIGENGTGKTSLLEALDMLSRRRTFRTGYARGLMRHDENRMQVAAKLDEPERTLAVEKEGQQPVSGRLGPRKLSRSQQARLFPLRIIHSGCHDIINTPSLSRQHVIDWGVFHVERRFFNHWKKYRHVLAQRNILLYQNAPNQQIKQWDAQMSLYAEKLDLYRQDYVDRLMEKVDGLIQSCWSGDRLLPRMSYQRGWQSGVSLEEVLESEYQKDIRRGYTQKGAHRAKIMWSWSDQPNFTPSGGQRKMLFSAMLIGQVMICEEEKQSCCLAIDDFPSELDENNQRHLWRWLQGIHSLVMITSLGRLSCLESSETTIGTTWRLTNGQIVKA